MNTKRHDSPDYRMNFRDSSPPYLRLVPLLSLLLIVLIAGCETAGESDREDIGAITECDPGDGGLTLPDGFGASDVADVIGQARHRAVPAHGGMYLVTRGEEGGGAP